MSTAHFSRQFRAAYGETPYAYLMTRRIERAKALLRRGDVSVTEVCLEVGCTSLGSFSARFTELVGETPDRLSRPRPQRPRSGCPAASPGTSRARAASRAGTEKRSRSALPNVGHMDLTLSHVLRRRRRPRHAPVTFYRDALGLEVRNDVANEGSRWITVGAPSQPGIAIVLTNYLNGSPADRDADRQVSGQGRAERRPLPLRGRRRHVREAVRRRWRGRIVPPTADQFWRACATSPCATPAGNLDAHVGAAAGRLS